LTNGLLTAAGRQPASPRAVLAPGWLSTAHPAACRRGGATGQHAVQGRRRVAAAAVIMPDVSQRLSAPHPLPPAPPPAPAHPRDGLREAMAPRYASDGSRVDRACLEPERGLAVSGAAVAPASGGGSQQRGGKPHGEGACADDVRLHGLRRGRHQGGEGRWEARRALSSRPFCPCDSRRVSLWYFSAGLRYTTPLAQRGRARTMRRCRGWPAVRPSGGRQEATARVRRPPRAAASPKCASISWAPWERMSAWIRQ
jgi:hypothetical protein